MPKQERYILVFLLRTIVLLSLYRPAANAFLSLRIYSRASYRSIPLRQTHIATMSQKSTSSASLNDLIDKESILWKWACHDDDAFHDFSPEQASEIRESLLVWYRVSRRKLPWRGDSPPYDGSTAGVNSGKPKKQATSIRNFFAPKESSDSASTEKVSEETTSKAAEALPVTGYGVWVSEIMLQQTRVEAIIPYYLKWMKRFPTVYDLADASEEDVNSHWAGLGFYRRARLLHTGAKRVVELHDGQLPHTVDELIKIDGIGRYTASAIASIAFDMCVPVVDGNVCRVLSRLRGIGNHIKAPILKDDRGWKLAKQIVNAEGGTHAGEVNQALMELGATYCAPSGTGTDERDPLKKFYMSPQIGLAFMEEKKRLMLAGFDSFPVEKYLNEAIASREHVCKLCEDDGVRSIFDQLSGAAKGLNGNATKAGHLGHGVFPTAPPKKAKQEEVLAVAVLSYVPLKKSVERRWLLVKRPANGLLAGQWEFPSACVWTSASTTPKSAKKRKSIETKVPTIVPLERMRALDSLLQELSSEGHDWLEECNRHKVGAVPIEHIFSHVRHTMWIEHGDGSKHMDESAPDEWTSPEGKELRWMSEDDMHQVGVTAGVKKILKAVKQAQREQTNKKARKSVN